MPKRSWPAGPGAATERSAQRAVRSTADSTASLQFITAALPQSFDPNDHRAHGGGRPPDTADRDQPAVTQITTFLTSKTGPSRQ